MESLRYKIAACLIPKVGPVLIKNLISYTGSIEAVFKEKKAVLSGIPGIGNRLAENILCTQALEKAETEIEYINENYPERLKQCEDSPVMIFVRGNIDLNKEKIISIVGTRKASEYGKQLCERLVREITSRDHRPVIVSGLAYGIDICAHRSALKCGQETAAILGHGLSFLYPSLHRPESDKILENGALITDFIHDQKPEPGNFIRRNRIIAGLADATIVVESGIKGGALITAEYANSYNRDVFAFPGRVGDAYSEGCNRLIKTHKAALIEDVKDLEYILGWSAGTEKKAEQKKIFHDLTEEEKLIVNVLKEYKELSIDRMCVLCKMPVNMVSSSLINLEFNGIVRCLPGKIYQII
jgi:DNA processing protein